MTEKDNILRLAREAGFGNYAYEAASLFEKFAALVKAEAVAETREACAKLITETKVWRGKGWQCTICPATAENIASAIRAMGATPSREGEA